jgi:hypothetical protein
MTNVSLEKGSVIIDKNIQEKMYIKKWIKIENVSHQRIFLCFIYLFRHLTFPIPFFFGRAGINFMVHHPRRANARRKIIRCLQKGLKA